MRSRCGFRLSSAASGGSGILIVNDGTFDASTGPLTINKTGTLTINGGNFNARGDTTAASDLKAWDALASVPAVRNHKVFMLQGEEFVVPGPRVAV